MKTFFAFVRKEFYHILRDKRTILILIVQPIVQICLFGFALSVEIRNINVAVVDPQPTEASRRIVERVNANEYFTVTENLSSPEEIDPVMKSGKVDVALIFSQDFENDLVPGGGAAMQLAVDASNPNTATTEAMYLTQILRDYLSEKSAVESTPSITPSVRMLYNPQMKSSYNFVPGVMGLLLILICALMTSVSIVREKETGTMEALLVSPVKPVYIIFAKMIPYFTVSCFNFATILLLSYFVLGVPLAGSMFWLCTASFIYIIIALSLGLLISTIVEKQATAMMASMMALMLPVIMLSGMIFPIESMPSVLQWISNIVPARWYISITRKLMVEGVEFRYIIKEMIILTAMALLLITVALKNLKNRL